MRRLRKKAPIIGYCSDFQEPMHIKNPCKIKLSANVTHLYLFPLPCFHNKCKCATKNDQEDNRVRTKLLRDQQYYRANNKVTYTDSQEENRIQRQMQIRFGKRFHGFAGFAQNWVMRLSVHSDLWVHLGFMCTRFCISHAIKSLRSRDSALPPAKKSKP